MPPLISLDDDTCLDPTLVGVKAANLAKARRAGLPVLPGVVVPITVGRTAIELGLEVLRAEGPGKARLAVDRAVLSDELAAVVWAAGAALGDNLILRSSTTLDDDDRFSGAFASIADVRPDEVASAVRGCWSSLFSADALHQFAQTGASPAEAGMAVLIQRRLVPACGGTAVVDSDGVVRAWATRGAPGPLLAGLAVGVRGAIDGALVDRELLALAAETTWWRLADACRFATERLGFGRFEWATEDDRTWILQLAPVVPQEAVQPRDEADPRQRVLLGLPASPGRSTGTAIRVGPENLDPLPDVTGAIVVVDDPLPLFAPLLWQAAGLVALRGDGAAHLCQVARSLHIPAVVGLERLQDMSGIDFTRDTRLTLLGDIGEVRIQ